VFTVRDGKIVKFASIGKLSEFNTQMRAPFAEWLAETYPRDFAVMYGRSIPLRSSGFTRVRGRPTEESIRLWRVRIPEYVEARAARNRIALVPATRSESANDEAQAVSSSSIVAVMACARPEGACPCAPLRG
jgi:hypothetical protein